MSAYALKIVGPKFLEVIVLLSVLGLNLPVTKLSHPLTRIPAADSQSAAEFFRRDVMKPASATVVRCDGMLTCFRVLERQLRNSPYAPYHFLLQSV